MKKKIIQKKLLCLLVVFTFIESCKSATVPYPEDLFYERYSSRKLPVPSLVLKEDKVIEELEPRPLLLYSIIKQIEDPVIKDLKKKPKD